jgi:hypothetical protein
MRLRVEGGGTAEITETDGVVVTLRATHPSPPGSMLRGCDETTNVAYKVKVRGCRRAEGAEPAFVIDGRFVDLTKAMREMLLSRPHLP